MSKSLIFHINFLNYITIQTIIYDKMSQKINFIYFIKNYQ